MRSTAEYIEYFKSVLTAYKVEVLNIDEYATRAVESGLQRFWGASDWSFKQVTDTLVISTSSDYYELPTDFDSMVTLREETSQSGLKLDYMSKEEFDSFVPKQSVWESNSPYRYTIFNTDLNKKVISIYPRPSALTLYMLYLKTTPNDTLNIPDKFQTGVEAAIALSIFLPNNPSRSLAYSEFRAEVKRLEVQDKQDQSRYREMFLEDSEQKSQQSRWWNY